MLKSEWNALRLHDKVLVHDTGATDDLALVSGVVSALEAHPAGDRVGVRIAPSAGEPTVLWPSYLTVHRDPRDPSQPCWRCQTLTETASQPADPV